MVRTSVATFFSIWVLLMHGSAFADSECSVAETNEDLSSAMQTKVTKETHASQETHASHTTQAHYTVYQNKNCYDGNGGVSIDDGNTAPTGLDQSECEQRCTNDPTCECVTHQRGTGKCWKRKQCDPSNFAPGGDLYDVYVKPTEDATFKKDTTYRNLFTVTMPKDKRKISIDGANKNFRDWVAETLLPLAATKAKKFYSCERGDSMSFYMEFADRNQADAFLNIFAWKPCVYFQGVKDSESTFAGLDNGGTKWQSELSEHAFNMGISCGDCKLIEPVQPLAPVKVCTAEEVQAIIAASGGP